MAHHPFPELTEAQKLLVAGVEELRAATIREVARFEEDPASWADPHGMRYRCSKCHRPMLSMPGAFTSGTCACGGQVEADPQNTERLKELGYVLDPEQGWVLPEPEALGLPGYLRLLAPAEGGGWVVRNAIDSPKIARAVEEGWHATPSGPHHCLLRRRS